MTPTLLSADDKRKCLHLHRQNLSTRAIAEFLGTSQHAVSALLEECGVGRSQSEAASARYVRTSPRREDAPYTDPELDDIRALCRVITINRALLYGAIRSIGRTILWGVEAARTHYYSACLCYIYGSGGTLADKRSRTPLLWDEGCSVLRIARTLDTRTRTVTAWLREEEPEFIAPFAGGECYDLPERAGR